MRAYTLHLHQDTARDLLVSLHGDAEAAFWLSKDKIEIAESLGGIVVCRVPDWLAKERGMLV